MRIDDAVEMIAQGMRDLSDQLRCDENIDSCHLVWVYADLARAMEAFKSIDQEFGVDAEDRMQAEENGRKAAQDRITELQA